MSYRPPLGCTLDQIDTPALIIDLDVLERNMAGMMKLCREHKVNWRPHSKAHKSPEIARMEVAAGAIGVTCAKLGEAEVMAAGGIRDILIANQIVGPIKVRRLVELAHIADPIIAVDDIAQVQPISDAARAEGVTIRMILEVDIGMSRSGVAPLEPSLRLAQFIADKPGIKFEGIMGYEGHLLLESDLELKARKIREAMQVLVATRDLLVKNGLPCPIVSAGGTGSFATTMTCPGITELQAGGLIFMDNYYRLKCQVPHFEYAITLLVTVTSRPAPDRAIIDAGRKTHILDVAPPTVVGHEKDIQVLRLSAEHGQLELSPPSQGLKVGDRLQIIPGYTDFTTVLHDEFYGFRKGRLEAILPLAGRGKLR